MLRLTYLRHKREAPLLVEVGTVVVADMLQVFDTAAAQILFVADLVTLGTAAGSSLQSLLQADH